MSQETNYTKGKLEEIEDLRGQIAILRKTPIVITDRYYIQTLHLIKNIEQTICNQYIRDIIGGITFQVADLTIPNRSKKCKRCFPK